MIFEIDKPVDGDWFPYFESSFDSATGEIKYEKPEENAAEFCVRSPAPFWEERRKDRKKENKMVVNPLTKSMERVSYYADLSYEEEKKENEALWDYVITGIRNAFDGNNKPIDCTKENKIKLLKIPSFLRYIQRVLMIISDAGTTAKEASEKN